MQQQKAQPTNTGALGGVVASIAGLIVGLAFAPIGIVIGLVVLVLGLRALRTGHPDRGWWTAATVLAVACLASGISWTVLALIA